MNPGKVTIVVLRTLCQPRHFLNRPPVAEYSRRSANKYSYFSSSTRLASARNPILPSANFSNSTPNC